MRLDYIFVLISIISFGFLIFFALKAPKYMGKLEAILLCLFGTLVYNSLGVHYNFSKSAVCAIFNMISVMFLITLILSIFGELRLFKKWQAIGLSLFGLISYICLWAACYLI